MGDGRKAVFEQSSAVVGTPNGRHTEKNRVFLFSAKPARANHNYLDQPLLGFNGVW